MQRMNRWEWKLIFRNFSVNRSNGPVVSIATMESFVSGECKVCVHTKHFGLSLNVNKNGL